MRAASQGNTTNTAPGASTTTPAEVENASPENKGLHIGTHIALLVPMSGASQKTGVELIQAAQLALFDAGTAAASGIALQPFDTKNTDEGTVKAMKQARAAGADIILGRFSRASARLLHDDIKNSPVPVIALSNDASLAPEGMLVLGSTPSEQIETVVDYAFNNNIRALSLLVADNDSGRNAASVVKEYILNNTLKINGTESYRNVKAGLMEGLARILAQPAAAPGDSSGKSEALLMPDAGSALLTLLNRMKQQPEIGRRFQLLGSSAWDDESFSHEKALLGAWFATTPPELRKQFEDRFQATYNYRPLKSASLAYDAVSLTVSLAKGGGISREALADAHGFNGINGLFRFNVDGLAEHSLVVMEITEYGFAAIQTGADSF